MKISYAFYIVACSLITYCLSMIMLPVELVPITYAISVVLFAYILAFRVEECFPSEENTDC